jgi:hypothetical protein
MFLDMGNRYVFLNATTMYRWKLHGQIIYFLHLSCFNFFLLKKKEKMKKEKFNGHFLKTLLVKLELENSHT